MKNILLAICLCISTVAFSQTNRGRIQAQGNNPTVEISKSWASNTVLTKNQAIALLEELWNSLSATEKKDRQKAYTDAKAYINSAGSSGTCVSSTLKKTFQDPQRKDNTARIDIEIITGCAFKN